MIAFSEIKEFKDVYSRLIAVIFETLVYEFNPGIRYAPDAH
jgi:hypothetical protein